LSPAAALAENPNNKVLEANNLNQFLPPSVLNNDNPDAARDFIRNSNNEAYQKTINSLSLVTRLFKMMAAKHPNDLKWRVLINVMNQLKDKVVAARDKQTENAIAQFDKYYNAALANSGNPAQAAKEASAKYNEWIFYYNSESMEATTNPTLFATGAGDSRPIEMNDVKQGYLDDCYFMAAIAALARSRPDWIEKMIRDNGNGTYTVTFYREVNKKTQKVEMTVDLKVPSNRKRVNLSGDMNTLGESEVWPTVLEKAYAQYKGSYAAIGLGGTPGDALFTLTGVKSSYSPTSKVSAATIEKYLAAGRPMVVGTPEGEKKALGEFGLHRWHDYTVQGVLTINGEKCLILYNPWGNEDPLIPWKEKTDPAPIPFSRLAEVLPNFWVS